MANLLVELRYSGLPNRSVQMPDKSVLDCWATIKTLSVAAIGADMCWHCFGHGVAPIAFDYLLSYGVAGEVEYAIVSRQSVISTFKGTLLDPEGRIRAILSPLLGPLKADVVELAPSPNLIGNRHCPHDAGHHKSPVSACDCGSASDVDRWLPLKVCEASNCLNYAGRDIWCRGIQPARYVGAMPQARPANPRSYEQWAEILRLDGILRSDASLAVPHCPATGWHIALAVNESGDFHFLRLDGDSWSHKSAARPPQRCDTLGAPILKYGLKDAHLCDYQLVGYFYVPRPLTLDR